MLWSQFTCVGLTVVKLTANTLIIPDFLVLIPAMHDQYIHELLNTHKLKYMT